MGRSRSYLAGKEWYEVVGYRDAPLSGEWAGESMPEIARYFGIDNDDFDADEFEEGFFSAQHGEDS
jgi:hypothetical protein